MSGHMHLVRRAYKKFCGRLIVGRGVNNFESQFKCQIFYINNGVYITFEEYYSCICVSRNIPPSLSSLSLYNFPISSFRGSFFAIVVVVAATTDDRRTSARTLKVTTV